MVNNYSPSHKKPKRKINNVEENINQNKDKKQKRLRTDKKIQKEVQTKRVSFVRIKKFPF